MCFKKLRFRGYVYEPSDLLLSRIDELERKITTMERDTPVNPFQLNEPVDMDRLTFIRKWHPLICTEYPVDSLPYKMDVERYYEFERDVDSLIKQAKEEK